MAKQAVQAANDAAPAGHNSGDDEKRVVFFIDRNAYIRALATKKAADAALKNVCKTIKADLGEHGLDQIKAYEQAQTPEGKAKLQAEFEARRQAMAWAGIPVDTQLDMFAAPARDDRAYLMGEEAGLRGETLANPYNEASEDGKDYARGWHDGQGKLFAGIKKKETAASGDELITGAEDPGFEDEAA